MDLFTNSVSNWSEQQQQIITWFEHPEDNLSHHLIVRARAGSGKTTTIIEAVKHAPEPSILLAAFSKIIQEELQRRIGDEYSNVVAKTLHSVGYQCVRRFRERIGVSFGNERAMTITDKVCERNVPDTIKRLISKLHTKGREIQPHATEIGDLSDIAVTFECIPDPAWAACQRCGFNRVHHVDQSHKPEEARHPYQGFDQEFVEEKALQAMEVAANVQNGETIDGSDMIFLPVRNGWLTGQYDLVVVDEAQDMSMAQLEIAQGVLRPGGRIAIVGDDRQAIFGFRGADSRSLDRLKQELNAQELGLNTTYRCGRRIVQLATIIVSDFKAGPNNPEGVIEILPKTQLVSKAGPGDFVLSRVNAPLVSTAMQLLRAGKRTRVAGRDIGAGLKALIRRLKGRSVPELLKKIEAWDRKESNRLLVQLDAAEKKRKPAIQNKLEAIHDQADMLISLADGAKNVGEVEARIEALFTDDGLGAQGVITCSSVHRAKGLEAERVFIFKSTLRNNNIEEENIEYVAITRAKSTLVWITEN